VPVAVADEPLVDANQIVLEADGALWLPILGRYPFSASRSEPLEPCQREPAVTGSSGSVPSTSARNRPV
jgi:hypothetical protein